MLSKLYEKGDVVRVISCMNLKGGASKSMTVVHASAEAEKRGLKVLIVDTDDPQHSVAAWASARGKPTPVVIKSPTSKLRGVIEKARKDGFDLVLIDTSPRLGPNAIDVATLSDRVIVPVKPDPFDMHAVQETIAVVKRAGVDTLLFLACCKSDEQDAIDTREILEESGLPVARTVIGQRNTFKSAVKFGKSVVEHRPKSVAAAEMNALMDEVLA